VPDPCVRIDSAVPGRCVVTVSGEIDLDSVPALHAVVDHVLAEPGQPMLVVDLGGLGFADSSVLRMLMALRRRLPAGSRLVVVCDDRIRRLLDLTGLADAFVLARTLAAADPGPAPARIVLPAPRSSYARSADAPAASRQEGLS
jgi:anti-sigma B factor antagonist